LEGRGKHNERINASEIDLVLKNLKVDIDMSDPRSTRESGRGGGKGRYFLDHESLGENDLIQYSSHLNRKGGSCA